MNNSGITDEMIVFGYLHKKGEKGPVKSWKKRWFYVTRRASTRIVYCRGPNDKDILGTIELHLVKNVIICEDNLGLKKDKDGWAFQVITEGRTYSLLAPGEKTRAQWVKVIKALVSKTQDGGVKREATPQYGQLFVSIKEANGVLLSKEQGHLGAYCVLTLEKQNVKTSVLTDFNNVRWNEGFFFDVTQLEQEKDIHLVISVWAQDISQNRGKFLGQLKIPTRALYHEKPIDQTFKLQAGPGDPSFKAKGELHLKLNFTNIYSKVGLDDFDLLKVVGKGNFGKVMQVRKKDTGRIYAMKVLKKDDIIAADAVQHTLSESNVLKRLSHPFIVNLKYCFQTPKKLYMILDYLSGGELFYHLSNVDRFSEERARFYSAEIIMALGYLHQQKVIYRDLKPENLLLDISGHVCLTDFGLVKEDIGFGDHTNTFCGSPEYLAPEILLHQGYGKEVDWWALGTFLYEMLEGLPPFYDENLTSMNRKILAAPLYFDPDHFSAEAKSLLRGLLQRDPKLRLGSGPRDAKEIMEHPFFASVDWERMGNRGYDPEFKPHLQSIEDVRYFDPEFTSETPKDSFVDGPLLTQSKQDLFDGFSYVSTSAFEQLIKQRRKVKSQLNTFSDLSTDQSDISDCSTRDE